MNTTDQNLEALRDIRSMMERSSRFISLSGWSGIAAGICALVGASLASNRINEYYEEEFTDNGVCPSCLQEDLLLIAGGVFISAFITAMFFTYLKSKKEGTPIWGNAARRLLWNTLLPMLAGGVLLVRMMELKHYELIAPASLIFYGLALINGSKYTMGEVRYLGCAQILTGFVALWAPHSGLYCWAFGFGVLHILYGIGMWWKHERNA